MSIPVRNLYYLLLYSWGHFNSGALRDVGQDDSPDLPNLLASVLLDGTRTLLRRGLDRGYVTQIDELKGPRGKLCFAPMMKQQTLRRGVAVCEIDELTHDIPRNQILLATIEKLATCNDVENKLRHDLRLLACLFTDVSRLRLNASVFHRVQVSRNTAAYGFLMRVCEFIYWSILPDDKGDKSRFKNIIDDETRMSALFESFLRNFYRIELPSSYKVGSEIMRWDAVCDPPDAEAVLPVMRTDITIRSEDHVVVADAKFYASALATTEYGKRIHAGNLYQIRTYLAHAEMRERDRKISGILIYPKSENTLRYKYKLIGLPVTIATVDLSGEWRDIHTELLDIFAYASEGKSALHDAREPNV